MKSTTGLPTVAILLIITVNIKWSHIDALIMELVATIALIGSCARAILKKDEA